MLSKQIEKAQRKVEEQNFLIRKRVLEYDDVMNEQRRIVYEYRDNVLEGKDMGAAAREEIGSVIRRIVEEYTPGDYVEEWDLDGLFVALDDIWPTSLTAEQVTTENLDREELIDRLTAGRGRPLRPARGRARRRAHARARAVPAAADHRQPLARAPLRHGLPARGHPPARVRPDRTDRRLQERGVRALLRPDEHDLVGLRADDLPRRGRGRGRERRRAPEQYEPRPSITAGGSSTRAGQVTYTRRRRAPRSRARSRRPRAPAPRSGRTASRSPPRRTPPRSSSSGASTRGADRPQRPVLVRLGQEVQEVPRGLSGIGSAPCRVP